MSNRPEPSPELMWKVWLILAILMVITWAVQHSDTGASGDLLAMALQGLVPVTLAFIGGQAHRRASERKSPPTD